MRPRSRTPRGGGPPRRRRRIRRARRRPSRSSSDGHSRMGAAPADEENSMSAAPAVRVERDGPVTTVILSRPEVRNAVDQPTARALADAFLAFERDPEAKIGVLFGDNGAFCAGADLKAISAGTGNRMLPPKTGDAWD